MSDRGRNKHHVKTVRQDTNTKSGRREQLDFLFLDITEDEIAFSPKRANLPRYSDVDERKASGATFTPRPLAQYLAKQLATEAQTMFGRAELQILDPALGDGVLIDTLLEALDGLTQARISVTAFETNIASAELARAQLRQNHPQMDFHIHHGNFLEVLAHKNIASASIHNSFDLVIANPPYVRTQVLGAEEARALARRFGLEGRVDLYHAFLLAMVDALRPGGMLGVITSNRFMTTRGAGALRSILQSSLALRRIWDLGDTKIFEAAVLPALLVGCKVTNFTHCQKNKSSRFTTIYETKNDYNNNSERAGDVVSILDSEGLFEITDGRRFVVQQGTLDRGDKTTGIWRLSTSNVTSWLEQVARHTWAPLRDIGHVRVGVKTTADRVFIRDDWSHFSENEKPELLRPLITHHVALRYRSKNPYKLILYPHFFRNGSRMVADLKDYPRSARYLEQYRAILESRKYLTDSGRRWYEIWVPQDPAAWCLRKLVFRDICERPTFWIDEDGCVVNGDCYWLTCENQNRKDLLYLVAAVCNSTFIEQFYDKRFNNKLYAGRRRFMTQYVEEFPIPNPESTTALEIVDLVKERLRRDTCTDNSELESQIDLLVWEAFGFRRPTPN